MNGPQVVHFLYRETGEVKGLMYGFAFLEAERGKGEILSEAAYQEFIREQSRKRAAATAAPEDH